MALKWWKPDENPSEIQKYAFALLDSGEVEQFIKHVNAYEVNVHIVDFNTASLLIKAQDVANDTSVLKKKLSEEERTARALMAVQFLLSKGANIDYQDKNGFTALTCAIHWGNNPVAQYLLQKGANPDLGSNTNNFFINPLLSACFKENSQMVTKLLAYGADVQYTLQLDLKTKGFKLTPEQRQFLRRAARITKVVFQRSKDKQNKKLTALTKMTEENFKELCSYIQ